MATNFFCDGVRRRDFLRVGALAGTGLTLAQYLQLAEAGAVKSDKPRAAIFLSLRGGPSHMDTFDLKPNAPAEFRGEYKPITTNAPGVQISEHLPKLAKCADKFAILRGVSHSLAAHEFGTRYMVTGNRPLASLEYPGYGAVVAKELPCARDLPSFVAIPNTAETAGHLGVQYSPLNTAAVPKMGQPFSVRGITIGKGMTIADVDKRQKLLGDLDRTFEGYEKSSDLLIGLDRFSQQAYEIISSKRARDAFDVSKESPGISTLFGDSDFAQSCLLASRLVEAGVRFVTVSIGGWDTHRGNFESLKKNLLPKLDAGLSGLLLALANKGLLETTSVIVTGEFGRTPKINPNAGRDHWPRAMFVVMAGGGMKTGQAIGASDDKAMGPAGKPINPEDVAASLYQSLGIDHTKEYKTASGRPIMIVRGGKPIKELFA